MTQEQSPTPEERVPWRERPIEEVASVLQETLGQRLVAYGMQERDPRMVGIIARGEARPSEEAERVMRNLGQVVDVLVEQQQEAPETIRAIMIGMNPALNDEAPIQMVHEGQSERVAKAAPYLMSAGF